MNIHLEIEHSREIDEWIRQRHYLGTVLSGIGGRNISSHTNRACVAR